MIDLNATYTMHDLRTGEPIVITPTVKTRVRDGITVTTVRGLAPLLTDRIDAITDEAERLHTLESLRVAGISIWAEGDWAREEGSDGITHWREHGRLTTTYHGTRSLPVGVVLDLAAELRTHLAGN